MHLPKRSEFLPCLGALLGLIMSASLPAAVPSRAASAARPNFIFILTDDHGWAESSVQMHPDFSDSRCSYLVTPNLERLAAAGMRFSSGYSPGPLCTPTRRALLVGMTAARDRGSEFKSNFFNPSQHLTIPKAFKAVDPAYRCAHFGKWGENMEASPTQCGYDESDGDTGNLTGNGPSNWRQGGEQTSPQPDPKLIFSLTDRAIDFISRQAREGRPFYMQVSHYAAHLQIQARPETIRKYAAKGAPPRTFPPEWAAMVEDVDIGIGKLLDKIEALGLTQNTYVIMSADNGGSPYGRNNPRYLKMLNVSGPDGRPGAANAPTTNANAAADALPDNFPLRGAKQWLYEGGIRVPFIVRGPGIKPGSWSHEPVAQYDLLPTMIDLAGGGTKPLSSELDGGSLRALFENDGRGTVRRPVPGLVFHRPGRGYSAYRSGDWKLVITWGPDGSPTQKELFDLSKDIGEQNNLAPARPEKAAEMWAVLSKYLKDVNAETVADFAAVNARKKGKAGAGGKNRKKA